MLTKNEKTIPFLLIPYSRFDLRRWCPSPRPRLAFFEFPDVRDPDIKKQIRYLKTSQQDSWRRRFGDTQPMTRRSPKKKPIKFSQCPDCSKYSSCKSLCDDARKYVLQDVTYEYTDWTDRISSQEDLSAETNPENAPNDRLDNIFTYSTDINETAHLFIVDNFDDSDVRDVYIEQFKDAYKRRGDCTGKRKQRTPPWAFKHQKGLWALYLYFERGRGVRELARMVPMDAGYASRIINQCKPVLMYHLEKVLPVGARRTYFYEKYFLQLTVTQIAEKYGVSHQTVSMSIRRSKKKIKKSLLKTVASRQRIRRGISFSQDGKKYLLTGSDSLV